MYVIMLHYKVGLDVMDAERPAHLDWLKKGYADGKLLASGRKDPPTGGVIIARDMPRHELDAYLATDPFKIKDLADYSVTAFVPALTAPELAGAK